MGDFAIAAGPFSVAYCFGTIPSFARLIGSDGDGALVMNLIVIGSTTSTRSTSARNSRYPDFTSGSRIRSKLYLATSAFHGSPFENFTFGRSVNCQVVGCRASSHSVASTPTRAFLEKSQSTSGSFTAWVMLRVGCWFDDVGVEVLRIRALTDDQLLLRSTGGCGRLGSRRSLLRRGRASGNWRGGSGRRGRSDGRRPASAPRLLWRAVRRRTGWRTAYEQPQEPKGGRQETETVWRRSGRTCRYSRENRQQDTARRPATRASDRRHAQQAAPRRWTSRGAVTTVYAQGVILSTRG